MAVQSLFAQLFKLIQEHLEAEVPEIRWIDQDLGQLEFYSERPPVSWPCILIDFDSTSYDQQLQGIQWGNLSFTLRLGFPAFSPANSKVAIAVKEKALKYYELENLVYQAMQGFDAGGLIQPCTRTAVVTEKRNDDNIRVRILTFSSAFEDSTAADQYSKEPRPVLDLDLEDEEP